MNSLSLCNHIHLSDNATQHEADLSHDQNVVYVSAALTLAGYYHWSCGLGKKTHRADDSLNSRQLNWYAVLLTLGAHVQ